MFRYFIYLLFSLSALQISRSQRRITGGKKVEGDKRYMVYLLKTPDSKTKYDFWLCGGVIVSPLYVVTSAACMEDVQYSYVIAGYNKYITQDKIDDDECTKEKKKKIVYICIPKTYDFEYEKVEKWSNIDIALAKVESPYDFTDDSYKTKCSYIPNAIAINYESKFQEPGIESFVLGWGHLAEWRSSDDKNNYNQEMLNYASTVVLDKKQCKQKYSKYKNLFVLIDKYMICTLGSGNINAEGDLINKSKPDLNGCDDYGICEKDKLKLKDSKNCCKDDETIEHAANTYPDLYLNDMRKQMSKSNQTNNVTRRQGICQNDHGGPLITWVGGKEVLIGVASVFLVDENSHCVGPYLFTSTQCNGAFLNCILNDDDDETRRSCKGPPHSRGFDMSERNISWVDHPDGPAQNENVQIRPQIPLNLYNSKK